MKIEFSNLNIKSTLKILSIILLIMTINVSNVLAKENTVTINTNSEWKAGSTVDITINSDIAESIYSGQISIDSNVIEVVDILPGKLLNDNIEKSTFNGEQGGHKTYYFSCLGNQKGISGNGELFVIKAKILENYQNINTDNLYITLYSNDNGVKEIKYNLKNNINVKSSFWENYSGEVKNIIISLIASIIITIFYYIFQRKKLPSSKKS